jgi:hypothetical protein
VQSRFAIISFVLLYLQVHVCLRIASTGWNSLTGVHEKLVAKYQLLLCCINWLYGMTVNAGKAELCFLGFRRVCGAVGQLTQQVTAVSSTCC